MKSWDFVIFQSRAQFFTALSLGLGFSNKGLGKSRILPSATLDYHPELSDIFYCCCRTVLLFASPMRGIWRGFFAEKNLTRGLCLTKLPHPWGKLSTLLHAFYNPPGRPGGRPLGQADDMCIKSEISVSCHNLSITKGYIKIVGVAGCSAVAIRHEIPTDLLCTFMQSPCPRVVSKSWPQLVDLFQTCARKLLRSRPFLHPSVVIINHGVHLRLLQHHLRHPHCVASSVCVALARELSPRQLSLVFVVPQQQLRPECLFLGFCEIVRVSPISGWRWFLHGAVQRDETKRNKPSSNTRKRFARRSETCLMYATCWWRWRHGGKSLVSSPKPQGAHTTVVDRFVWIKLVQT